MPDVDQEELNGLANTIEVLFDLPELTITCDYTEPGVCIPPEAAKKIIAETRASMEPRPVGLPDWDKHCDQSIQFGSFAAAPAFTLHSLFNETIAQLVAIGTCFCVNTSENTIYTTKRGAEHVSEYIRHATGEPHAEEEGS